MLDRQKNQQQNQLNLILKLVGEDADTIELAYEPYLLRKGYLEKTSRGRQIPAHILPQLIKRFLGGKKGKSIY